MRNIYEKGLESQVKLIREFDFVSSGVPNLPFPMAIALITLIYRSLFGSGMDTKRLQKINPLARHHHRIQPAGFYRKKMPKLKGFRLKPEKLRTFAPEFKNG